VFAEEEAQLLLGAAAGSAEELERLVVARVGGMPLEPLLGWAEFCGLRIVVEPGVFVPRRRTELLAECALEAVRSSVHATAGDAVAAVDLCCGTGAVGAVLQARGGGRVEVHAADLDAAAVANARRNIRPPENVHEGDLYDALPERLRGRVDVLAVNAPYVPTAAIATMPPEARDHEAAMALDGGDDGLDIQRRVVAGASGWLSPRGVLLIETSEEQSPLTAALLREAGLLPEIRRDDDRDATIVIGRTGTTQFL
jgi:release factor glutamine methyltransferase